MKLWPIHVLCMIIVALFCGCEPDSAPVADGKTPVYAGLPPVAYITSRIGGDAVSVKSLLPEGRSPHDYSPGPQDIRAASAARCFFTTGMPFEKSIARPLSHSKTKLVDVSQGVNRIPFGGADCADKDHDHDHDHDHQHHDGDGCSADGLDPHIWLDLENDKIIAENICRELSALLPERAAMFRANCDSFKQELETLRLEIVSKLKACKGKEFFVYHPAFGYFAHMTGLKQQAIELGGREATPAHLAAVIRRALDTGVKVIFVQPQFNPASARALAVAIKGDVAELDPLAADIIGNVRKMTDTLLHGFTGLSDPEE